MSNDAIRRLEQRVSQLEVELQQVKSLIGKDQASGLPWWKQIVGRHEGSPVFAEIVRLGRRIRREDRPRNKKKSARVTEKRGRSLASARAGE